MFDIIVIYCREQRKGQSLYVNIDQHILALSLGKISFFKLFWRKLGLERLLCWTRRSAPFLSSVSWPFAVEFYKHFIFSLTSELCRLTYLFKFLLILSGIGNAESLRHLPSFNNIKGLWATSLIWTIIPVSLSIFVNMKLFWKKFKTHKTNHLFIQINNIQEKTWNVFLIIKS